MKAVIFDMDGVLVYSEPKNAEQLANFMQEYGCFPSERFLNSLVGTSYDFTSQACIDYMNVKISVEEFKKKFDAYMKTHPYKYLDVFNKEATIILKWLKENGYKLAIASSSFLHQIQTMLDECTIAYYFDVILSGEMFKESKPNPEIYVTAAKKLGVSCEECLVIEDSFYGIKAGKRAGMKVLAVKDTHYGMDQSYADARICSLQEIKEYL